MNDLDKRDSIKYQARNLFDRLKAIDDRAKAENRKLSRREEQEVEKIIAASDDLKRQIDALPAPKPGRLFQGSGIEIRGRGPSGEGEPTLLGRGDSYADHVREQRGGVTPGGFSEGSFDDGSLGRVLRGMVTGNQDGLSDLEQRALAGSSGSGANLIVPELSGIVIDAARAKSVAIAAGAQTYHMGEPISYMPRLNSPVDAQWHAENDPLDTASQSWDRVELVAKTVAAGPLLISTELAEDIGEDSEAWGVIAGDLAKVIANAIDLAAFEGSGEDNQPTGIVNTDNVDNSVHLAGAAPTSYAEIVKAVYAVQANNGPMATAAVMRPEIAEAYALLTDTTHQPLRRPQAINDLQFLSTTELADDLTVGSFGDTSNIYVGDFSQLVLAFRPSVSVRTLTLRERYANQLSLGLIAYCRMDVGVRRPEFLSVIDGAPPAS